MSFTPTGGSIAILKIGTQTVPANDWKIEDDPKLKDCSNFLTGRFRVTTLADAKLTCKVMYDQDSQPVDPAGLNLVPGATVVAKAFVSPTKFYLLPGVVGKCTPALSSLEDVLMYDIEIELSGGAITRPTVP